jgi:uncharacterized protein (TIGR03067 family)
MLACRLARRGLVPAGAALATLAREASASVPYTLTSAATRAALQPATGAASAAVSAAAGDLAEEVLQAMTTTKTLRMAAAVLLAVAAIGTAAVLAAHQTGAADPPGAPRIREGVSAEGRQSDQARLLGAWKQVAAEFEGQDLSPHELPLRNRLVIGPDLITILTRARQNAGSWKYRLYPTLKPAAIDLTVTGGHAKGTTYPSIYRLDYLGKEGYRLTLCMQNFPDRGRPQDFKTTPASGLAKFVYERLKPGEDDNEAGIGAEATPPALPTQTDYSWLLKRKRKANVGTDLQRMLDELAAGKAPTPEAAVSAALQPRRAAGRGIDAQERTEVVGLIRVADPHRPEGHFVWIVRSSLLFGRGVGPHAVIEEVWVNAATGTAQVVFPFGGYAKK